MWHKCPRNREGRNVLPHELTGEFGDDAMEKIQARGHEDDVTHREKHRPHQHPWRRWTWRCQSVSRRSRWIEEADIAVIQHTTAFYSTQDIDITVMKVPFHKLTIMKVPFHRYYNPQSDTIEILWVQIWSTYYYKPNMYKDFNIFIRPRRNTTETQL
jgi:hypothetical protein